MFHAKKMLSIKVFAIAALLILSIRQGFGSEFGDVNFHKEVVAMEMD